MAAPQNSPSTDLPNLRAQTGIEGLDRLLDGGFPRNRLHLIQGDPGAGKTTLGLQYLLNGLRQGEKVMYITLSETKNELLAVASSHGWSLDGVHLYEYSTMQQLREEPNQTIFHRAEVELTETTENLLKEVERIHPARVVFDSLSEVRLLAGDPLRYRRQILELKQYFAGRQCTVLLLDDRTSEHGDLQLQSLAHGVVIMEQFAPSYGSERRRLRILKMRGVPVRGGNHDFRLVTGGILVFPRLVSAGHRSSHLREVLSSGISQLDTLLGGGLDRGTTSLLLGPAGSGKSSIALKYACAAAERGEKSVTYSFDERLDTIFARSEGFGMNLQQQVASGLIDLQPLEPAEMSPGEFSHRVQQGVEQLGVRVVVIDSLNGYLNAMPEERFLTLQLHELLTYLGQRNVTTLLVVAQHGIHAIREFSDIDVSYLADTVLLFRYYEFAGEVHQAISVFKKRSGNHERTIRELRLRPGGIEVGEILSNFRGVLTGTPAYERSDSDST
jgi:circadian clock protein KaiC